MRHELKNPTKQSGLVLSHIFSPTLVIRVESELGLNPTRPDSWTALKTILLEACGAMQLFQNRHIAQPYLIPIISSIHPCSTYQLLELSNTPVPSQFVNMQYTHAQLTLRGLFKHGLLRFLKLLDTCITNLELNV